MQYKHKTKMLLALPMLLAILILTSCDNLGRNVTPDGKVTSNTLSFTGIGGVSANNAFEVIVKISDTEENVVIEANENLHRYIEVTRSGNVIEVGLVHNVNIKGHATLRAIITTKSMYQFFASGASHITVQDSISAPNMYVDLSGASSLNAELYANHMNAELSGASQINLSGECANFELDLSGASEASGYDYIIETLNGDFSGASSAQLTIENAIYLDASGASSLQYKGNAILKGQDLSGGSTIQHVF